MTIGATALTGQRAPEQCSFEDLVEILDRTWIDD
jgi:hypothetical protein